MSRAWMPMYWGNYLGDTGHLSTVQHGAYLLLISHYWMNGSLPEDDEMLANITRLPPGVWLHHKPVVQAFFFDGWRHKRVEMELKKCAEKIAQAKQAGQKGGAVASINREITRHKLQRFR